MRQGRDISVEEKAVDDIFRSYANLSSILDVAGRLEEAVTEALTGSEEAARSGLFGKYYWYHRCNGAWSLFRLGRWDEASAVLQIDEEVHAEGISEVHLQASRTLLEIVTGRLERARPHVEGVMEMIRDIVDPQFLGPVHWMAALLEWFEGNLLEAWDLLEQGIDRVQKAEDWFYRAPLHVLGAAVAVDLAKTGIDTDRFAEAAGVHVRVLQEATSDAETGPARPDASRTDPSRRRRSGGLG